ncbi:hypothetical protein CLOM_g17213 [Closterium sp. NIES-68]|nr:hypothetical protein CLOM_g17213 [Closterium sp. NIES-68]GJP67269.1 hypothetical protein CLOP_g24106 [Closterium sp. NIES-67]
MGPVFNFKQYQAYAAGQGLWSPSGTVTPTKKTQNGSAGSGGLTNGIGIGNSWEEGQHLLLNGRGEVDKVRGNPQVPRRMPEPLPYAAQALGTAMIFVALHLFLKQYFSPDLLLHPGFFSMGFAGKWGYLVMAGICYRCSFFFIWGVAEAAVILSGFGFSGWSNAVPSRPDWSRAENVSPIKCEVTSSLAQMPAYWNIGVGVWLRTYVYDRITPRSGKPTMWTLILTQVVCAFWHGLHPGHYLFFVNAAIGQHTSKRACVGGRQLFY